MKYLIDCDPGVDDVLAIIYLFHLKGKEVLAVTTTGGNTSPSNSFRNALFIVRKTSRRDVKVSGSSLNTFSPPVQTAEYVHGSGGLGKFFEKSLPKKFSREESFLTILNFIKLYGRHLTIISTGPLTNLAWCENKEKGILKKLRKIVWMGGGINVTNVTEWAEFNAYFDPLAAKIVILSGADITVVPLDLTDKIVIHADEFFNNLKGEKKVRWFKKLLNPYIQFTEKTKGGKFFQVHDAVAVFCALFPEKTTSVRGKGDIITEGKMRGKFIFEENVEGKVELITGIDEDYFMMGFKGAIESFNP